MLRNAKIIAFLATTNAKRCRKFYESVLGLPLVSDDKFALAFNCKGTQLRIQKVEKFSPHPFTSLGWHVPNVRNQVVKLTKGGVTFETYPFLEQNELNIWQAPAAHRSPGLKIPTEISSR